MARLTGSVRQKSFTIADSRGEANSSVVIDITMIPNPQAPEPNQPGAAEATGWMVDVRYNNAPEIELFTKTFPTEEQAQAVMDDFSKLAAEVEGLIKQEKFEEAAQQTEALQKKFTANSSEPPVPTEEHP
jgi:hypothetical protein